MKSGKRMTEIKTAFFLYAQSSSADPPAAKAFRRHDILEIAAAFVDPLDCERNAVQQSDSRIASAAFVFGMPRCRMAIQ